MNFNDMTRSEIERVIGNVGRRAASNAAKVLHAQHRVIDDMPVTEIYDEVRDQVWDVCEARSIDFVEIGLDATEYGVALLA